MRHRPLSTPARLNVAAMVTAAGGILLQIASGSEAYPTIPLGPIILLAGAGVVALGPWRWSTIVGVAVPLFLTVGATIAAAAGGAGVRQLADPSEIGIFAGTVIQLLSVITALVAGIAARRIYGASAREAVSRPTNGSRWSR
jgi:hypothetical protein